MAQGNSRIGVAIRINELVVELEHILSRVEWGGAVRVHGQVGHCLVREKIWRAVEFEKSPDARGPVQFLKQQKETGIDGIVSFSGIAQEALVSGEPAIRQVKRRDIARPGVSMEIIAARKKEDVRIEVQDGTIFRQRHDESKLLAGRMRGQIQPGFLINNIRRRRGCLWLHSNNWMINSFTGIFTRINRWPCDIM